MRRVQTEADILQDIRNLVKEAKEERKVREGRKEKTIHTPYGKYEEVTIQGKKKNVYNINEKKLLSQSVEMNRSETTMSPEKKRMMQGNRKGVTLSVDDILRVYAEDMRNREKHNFSKEEVKIKTAIAPHVETTKKIESYLDVNKPPPAPTVVEEKKIEPGKDGAYIPEILDMELTIDPSDPSSMSEVKTKERLKHVSATRFKKKYPRFCSNLTFTDLDLKDIEPRNDKWIVRFMEVCYDEASNALNSEGFYGKVTFFEGMYVGNFDNFPFLVQRIISKYFSVLEVRKRTTLEILYTIELLLQRSEMGKFKLSNTKTANMIRFDSNRSLLFSKFLSEEYDIDVLSVFLYGRLLIQQTINQKLKDLNPARIVIKNNDKLIEKPAIQSKILQQQQLMNSSSPIKDKKLSNKSASTFFTETGNSYLDQLYENDKYLQQPSQHPSISTNSLLMSPNNILQNINLSSSIMSPTPSMRGGGGGGKRITPENLVLEKVVPVELPAKWYYLIDITCMEAPLLGFHESLLWYFTCLLIPPTADQPSTAGVSSTAIQDMNKISKIRQYFQEKCWNINLFDCLKDEKTNQKISKDSLHFISIYSFLRNICIEWKKLSREDKQEFSHEGLVLDSLKTLNEIYQDNCAKMKQMEYQVIDAESNLSIAKAEVIRIEKELKRYERKFSRKLTHSDEIDKISLLRESLHAANVHTQEKEQQLKDLEIEKRKLKHHIEELWKNVVSKSAFAHNASSSKKNKKGELDINDPNHPVKKLKEKEKKEAFWKNYVLFMFSKILEKNFEHEDTLKKSLKESEAIVANLQESNYQLITTKTISEPIEMMKQSKNIENLLISTISKIFVRNVLNDAKRKLCLQSYLKDKEESLLLAYGTEEHKQQYYQKKLEEKLAKERKEKEKLRKNIIQQIFTPFIVHEVITIGKEKAFQKLYDPFWQLLLDPITFLSRNLLEIIEKKFSIKQFTFLKSFFHILKYDWNKKKIITAHSLRLITKSFQYMKDLKNSSSYRNQMSKRITKLFQIFHNQNLFQNYYYQQQQLMKQGNEYYQKEILQKKRIKEYFLYWWKYKDLKLKYWKTKEALLERRFLICFYTWKDQFIKLKYSKLQLSKLQLKSCIIIQCTIRCFLSKRKVLKLKSKRKLFLMIRTWQAKKKFHQMMNYRRRMNDLSEKVRYNYHFYSLIKYSFRLWKKSYSILFGLTKLFHTKQHYNIRCRLIRWKEFTKLKTIYLSQFAIKLQSFTRMILVWKNYFHYYRWKRACHKFQALYRKHRAVYYFTYEIFYYRKAKAIQKIWRGYKIRKTLHLARIQDIHYAASHNKYDRLKYYCEKFPDLIYLKDSEGNTPLHSAAKYSAKRTMKLLIKIMNLNPNEENFAGYTALHLIIMSNAVHRDEIFEYCLDHGFNDDQLTSSGKSCVLLAAEYNRMVILKKLLDDGHDCNLADHSGLTPLQCACSQGNLAMVQLLIENDAYVHQPGQNGTFPIHNCITGGNIEILYLLLHHRVEINVTDSLYSQTPLMWACQAGLPEFIRTLIIHHADITAKDYNGQTCAHYAALTNISDVYHALREADVEFDVVDNEGNTPLHIAAYYGNTEMAKNILHGGVYASYQNDKDGEQPSHIAAKYNQLEILKVLCEYDEYIGRPNYHHQTPLGLAKFYQNKECIEFLEKHYRMIQIVDGRNNLGEVWWDKTIDENILNQWEMKLDSNGNRMYRNKLTGELSLKPPSVKSAEMIKDLAKKQNKLPLRRVIELVKEDDLGHGDDDENDVGGDGERKKTLTKHEYYETYRKTKADIKSMNKEYRNATIITKYCRRYLAMREIKRLRLLRAKFKVFRRFYRIYVRPYMAIRRQERISQIVKAQKLFRGYLCRKKFFAYPNGLFYIYRIRWAKRTLRYKLWSMYCFYRFMNEFKLKVKIKNSFNYTLTDWQLILDRLHHRPLRTINIYEEYKFPGTMGLKFYHNTLTNNCFFNKPKEIILFDENLLKEEKEKRIYGGVTRKQFALIVKLQSLIRGYLIRNTYKYLERAMRISQAAEKNYFNAPEKDINVYNYALFTFVMDQDIDRARPLFLESLRRMQWRGPDIAFVIYSYAIFAMKSQDEDINEIVHLMERGNRAERIKHQEFVKNLEQKYQNMISTTSIGSMMNSNPVGSANNSVASPSAAPGAGGGGMSRMGGSLMSPRDEYNSIISPRDDGTPSVVSGLTNNYTNNNNFNQSTITKGTKATTTIAGTTIPKDNFMYGRCYDLAKVGFFRYAARTINNSYGWECFAICQFVVYKDFLGSFDAFMEAFKTDPENLKLRKNFDDMMTYFHGKDKEYKDAIVKTRMRQLASIDNEVEENRRRIRDRAILREKSAARIQKWYKERKKTIIFNRFIAAVRANTRRYKGVTGGAATAVGNTNSKNNARGGTPGSRGGGGGVGPVHKRSNIY